MNTLIFVFFRRMRAPLLVLIGAYAISIGGLVLIPGLDGEGNPWRFDFFHAFYFVSFMGSTIGFGEIPHEFSGGQRLWTTVALYICVIAWLYAIGSILTLISDLAFQRIVAEQRFTRRVRRLMSPFFLICGYGETGDLLVRALSRRGMQSVVIDGDAERVNRLLLERYNFDIPSLCADAREVQHLMEAGLKHPRCKAVIALTNDEEVNVKIAITSKLLRPELPVICRANTQETAANLASFNTDFIMNPFKAFADHLAMALRTPAVHLLYNWLISAPNTPLPQPIRPPRGTWVICGFGRFGKEVHRYLQYEGVPIVVIEPDENSAPEGAIVGRGTEAVTLREAGIEKAVGLVAGADQDINNLSIVMTAKELNPDLYVVARQNRRANDEVFGAAELDLIMETSRTLVMRILPLLTTPLLADFLREVRHRNEDWAEALLARIGSVCDGRAPQTWTIEIGPGETPAVSRALAAGRNVQLKHLCQSPAARDASLDLVALMLLRGDDDMLLPGSEQNLGEGDQILFCARREVWPLMDRVLFNDNALEYAFSGTEQPDSFVWSWLIDKWQKPNRT